MKITENHDLRNAFISLGLFGLWTWLIRTVDVQPVGPKGTSVGLAGCNVWFHELTGVHMGLYTVTDWLGLVPIFICMGFGLLGLVQWIRRRRLLRVDRDLILLGIYYMAVIFAYLIFEMIPINYRPILINGCLEASYPSSTTLLVMSVMPTLSFQIHRRSTHPLLLRTVDVFAVSFTVFMVLGRLVAGVHWFTDILGSVFLSAGLYLLYRGAVRALASEPEEV